MIKAAQYIFGIICICFFSSHLSLAQAKNYKKGVANFQNGFYEQAIKEFVKVKDVDPALVNQLNLYIADSYRLSNRWLEAIPYFEKLIDKSGINSEIIFNYAYALKANQEYEKAKTYFQKYIDIKTTDKVLTERANREMSNYQLLSELQLKKSETLFNNLKDINTDGIEYSGIIKDDYLIYTASKKSKIYSNALPYIGIYRVKLNKDLSKAGSPEPFSDKILDTERNEGSPTFTADGKTMVFARGNTGKRKDKSADVDLYITKFVAGEGWIEPKLISVSDSIAWDGSPAFSRDGKTLYFASDRAGGNGGLDIYRVNLDASGRFGNAVNMGKGINTAGDEMFPFVAEDGKLYFASDGHPGLGKLDLFAAVRSGGKISVENMGLPYNSAMDDFGYFVDTKGNSLFTSNRAGGQGNDDIYYFAAPDEPKPDVVTENDPKDPKNFENDPNNPNNPKNIKLVNYFLAGNIIAKSDKGEISIDSALIKIFKQEAGVEELISEVYSVKGKYGNIKLEEDTDYSLLVEKIGFLNKREGFSMYGKKIPLSLLKKAQTDTVFYNNINLEQIFIGKTFRLENIYYDLDKFDIRADAALELDKLVQILKDNPNVSIELGSHTDTRGSDTYNGRLSQRRAESVINYLTIKGIASARLTAKGYGETELIIANAKNEDEHQINRRTEFKVIDIDKAP